MENLIHFIKHALGLCGESHPSLLVSGAGIIGYCIYCIRQIKNKWRGMNEKIKNK